MIAGSGSTYIVDVTGMVGNGLVVVSIPAGAATNAAGFASHASTSVDRTVTFIDREPVVTIEQAPGQADPTSTSPILFHVVFSEPVTGFTASGVSFAGSTVAGAPIQSDPTTTSPIEFFALFSEPVTGFTASDVRFAGSTVGGTLVATVIAGSGSTYIVDVTGMVGNGLVVVSIPAGAATNAAGFANHASTSVDHTVTFVDLSPTVTVTVAAVDANAAEGAAADPGRFTVSRAGDFSGALVVQLGFAGPRRSATTSSSTPISLARRSRFQPACSTRPSPSRRSTTPWPRATRRSSWRFLPGTYLVGAPASATVTISDDDLVVTNTDDSGVGSLRQAILDANAHVGITDTIRFDIPGPDPTRSRRLSPFPTITDPVVIDGTTQPGYMPTQLAVEITGPGAGPDANGLVITPATRRFAGSSSICSAPVELGWVGRASFSRAGITTTWIRISSAPIPRDRGSDQIVATAFGSHTLAVSRNVIAFNGGAGVSALAGHANVMLANTFVSNAQARHRFGWRRRHTE